MQMNNYDKAEASIDMVTISGWAVNFLQPELTPIDPEDLRRSTINICRYNGHIDWRLVQHLWLVVELARFFYPGDPLAWYYCGTHDLHETLVQDIVSGFKRYLSEYEDIEHSWELHVHKSLGFPWKMRPHEKVKHIDRRALVIEMIALHHPAGEYVSRYYGGMPTADELQIMSDVRALSPHECWDRLWATLNQGRTYIRGVNNGES